MQIVISNIADKFKLKFKRLFYAWGLEMLIVYVSDLFFKSI